MVERSEAWAARFRRLARDDTWLAETLTGLPFAAFAILMLKCFMALMVSCITRSHSLIAARSSRSAKAGNLGVAVTDECGQAEAGIRGVAVVETGGTAEVSHHYAVAVAREGIAVAGDRSCALALPGHEALAGNAGLAMSWGDMVGAGKAEAGKGGVAIIDASGTAAAGAGGVILVRYDDGQRYRFALGYVGEEGIQPGISYGVDQHGKLVERRSV